MTLLMVRGLSFFFSVSVLFLIVAFGQEGAERPEVATNRAGESPSLPPAALPAAPAPPVVETAKPALRGAMVRLSDFGTDDVAYLSIPDSPPVGAVVLVPGMWGLDDRIKLCADRLARQGFVALAVDLFNGQVPTDTRMAADLERSLRGESSFRVIRAGIRFVRESPRFRTDRVALMGWEIGAGFVLELLLTEKGIDAGVLFYGPLELDRGKLAKLKAPVCGLYGDRDPSIPKEELLRFTKIVEEEHKPFDLHVFPAGSSFVDPRSTSFDPVSAEAAWNIAAHFLDRHLAEGGDNKKDGGWRDLFRMSEKK
ncbi:dienelactone hydrolase family protein [Verrucomicrobium sp. 3C]|uniref:dienelactone hydrolase family protein n=1 Tax=Verrucomicrobium sp. 3C TaxID=1134055 RepID=UPI0003814E10|nr:dienelactone hydrolase family protein [Verrucomicrobium sp. 3C]